jgi:hypothetical protein
MNREEIETKAVLIANKIDQDFRELEGQELEDFFDKFQNDKRTLSFIDYYNRTVLDKEKINFGTFSYQWALHLPKTFYTYFNENFNYLANEIKNNKNLEDFHKHFCITQSGKRMSSFCSKLFHTLLPSEFPPVDNPIRKQFGLQKEDFITSVLIIKRGYELFIQENPKQINLIRTILSKDKFSYLRINRLSDIRILDMYYWFKENREKLIKK